MFAGTPEAAVPGLVALASRHDVVAVVTREDAPLGRKRVLTPSPVAVAADRLGLVVVKANRLDDSVTARLNALEPDLGVIVAYGGLVRQPLLSAPVHGWINLHFSVLPAWRGAAPVQRAIMAGDMMTGTTVFRLVAELDAGDILAARPQNIGADETAGELLGSLADSGAQLLTTVADALADGSALEQRQRGEVSYAHKMTIEDARIDWTVDGQSVYDRIRGVTPEPGAFTTINLASAGNVGVGSMRVKILSARLAAEAPALVPGTVVGFENRILIGSGTQPIELLTLQPAGKKPMRAEAWFRGLPRESNVTAA